MRTFDILLSKVILFFLLSLTIELTFKADFMHLFLANSLLSLIRLEGFYAQLLVLIP